jgi:hypothetical protein
VRTDLANVILDITSPRQEIPGLADLMQIIHYDRRFAQGGGISALAYGGDTAPTGYGNPAFEGMVPGAGTGMSDSVPFSVEGQQPALLSRDEYVLPADVVSQLGDGSSGAGSEMLDQFVSQVRQNKYGHTNQPPANGGGLMSALTAAAGGSFLPKLRRV